MGSVLLTLSVSVERYHSVCHPLRRFPAKRLLLPCTVAFAVAYDLPRFFEFGLRAREEDGAFELAATELRKNPDYFIYYNLWSKFVFVEVRCTEEEEEDEEEE